MHSALHICMSSRPMCKAPCLCAKSSACMQRGVFMMCSSACICAMAVCSFADPSARVHHRVFIGSGPCMYARRRVYFAKGRVYVQSVVLVCTRLCLCAARRVYLHVHLHGVTVQFQP